MTNINEFLTQLLSIPGIAGFEEPASKLIKDMWQPLVDEVSTSQMGSLHALRKAVSAETRPTLMIATHMDAIGLMVKEIKDEYLFFTQVGGIDPRILPGQLVTIHGRKEISGIVQVIPDRLLPQADAAKAPEYSRLFVDTGLKANELKRLVQIGDIISFAQSPVSFGEEYIAGHSLDNRASVAALTVCLQELKHFNLQWNLVCVATTQEEVGGKGAYTSTFHIEPDIAIAVDVTFAKGPGSSGHETFPLGKGPTIGIGGNNHPALFNHLKNLAEELDMPYAVEPMPRSSGTDAMEMQITRSGIPTFVVGIPIRYMHTPVELTAINDIKRAGRLLARFICGLDADSLTRLYAG